MKAEVLLLAGFLVLATVSGAATNAPPLNISLALHGRIVYQRNCETCHGRTGDGTGDMGLSLVPKPRNFRTGFFKFRSTPSGSLPTNDDLMRTIRLGLGGTAMPTFNNLREREIRAVAEYLKTFSHRWDQAENYAAPVTVPPTPTWLSNAAESKGAIERGKARFATACAPCHGEKADGKGSAASSLKDAAENPIIPSDLRKPLRCGEEPADIYRLLATGMDGTPMPSFASAFSEAELWELVAYVQSLRTPAAP